MIGREIRRDIEAYRVRLVRHATPEELSKIVAVIGGAKKEAA
jgi:hypothetical protein